MNHLRLQNLDELEKLMQPYFDEIDNSKEWLISETIEITETIAPPFKEERRAKLIEAKFKSLGYETRIDKIGNVLACVDLNNCRSSLVVSAHLDTVFPETTEIRVRREGDLLFGPGIGDDSRGLAVLLFLAKLMLKINTIIPILFVATVGEEGTGDLRGVKHLFQDIEHDNLKIKYFITIDGSDTKRVVNRGIGSIRYKIFAKGPGGHSFGAFGTVNPAYALSQIIHNFSKIKINKKTKTTYSVGVIGGGTSVNSIPSEVWAEFDLRSESQEDLEVLSKKLITIVDNAVEEENRVRNGQVFSEVITIGNRPVGVTDQNSELIKAIIKANTYFNLETDLVASSTDANVPMSIGVPGISIAGVETAKRVHSVDEWIDAGDDSLLPIKRNMLLILLLTTVNGE